MPATLAEHPAFAETVRRYRVALGVWEVNQSLREGVALIGMGRREYCDRYVAFCLPSLAWTQDHADAAWEQAWKGG